ncbi:hypothetical protein N7520_008511 [Penicillium odoratum]|uniref:uncharacterized protein n=1 Tax=Penicillium odoratum TaxID=1167516 RepID=UPI002547DCB2|nr:uncharacterized protein N7520_008511 [Penicillium odoratum]KAJ5751594.1 hypothetical protein N7520_008511 [Penicillium odoratum]
MERKRKIISVIGATGQQGGSVTRSLLQNPDFCVRCITRDASSVKAKELKRLGAEIVQADGNDPSLMTTALHESWGIFINNGYALPPTVREGKYEEDFGNIILKSAADAKVPHVVFSSQPSAYELSGGKIRTPVLDAKAWGESWGRACPAFQTFTPIMASWYFQNFFIPSFVADFGGFPWAEDAEGYLTLRIPPLGGNEEVPWICVDEDFGDLVHGIFLNPTRWNKRTVQAVGDILSYGDLTTTFADVTQRKARYIPYYDLAEMPVDRPYLHESRQVFAFYHMRDGELFGGGITENRTASVLKGAAFQAKGQKGRETLMSAREWFEKHFTKSIDFERVERSVPYIERQKDD